MNNQDQLNNNLTTRSDQGKQPPPEPCPPQPEQPCPPQPTSYSVNDMPPVFDTVAVAAQKNADQYAIAGFVLGLLFGVLTGIFGLIFSLKAKKRNTSYRGLAQAGFILSIIGIVLGVVGFVVYIIFLVTMLRNLSPLPML